ncbi:plasmid partition protein ParG [Sporosarcina limicola]|uniref:HicB family RNase H-like nuclease n=1 Tax=Sporosarcina limicola TaxID=34101 RepID=A0A927RG29_9BACL|nr:plasmid partition protein ParG [Sporosarcina limicola]MBE1556127.1 putative HicB family RNase H-like nuclease [Sporosarcina limicola]
MTPNGKSRLATNIDEDLHHQFKIQAVKEKKKINELLENIIKNYLDEKK